MRRVVDFKKLSESINIFRKENQGKFWTLQELVKELCNLGFSKDRAKRLVIKNFPSKVEDGKLLYAMPEKPILKTLIEGTYRYFSNLAKSSYHRKAAEKKAKKQEKSDKLEEAINLLKENGYIILKQI
jgi:hypothetical protein